MEHLYHEESPLSYIRWLTPLDYGQFQDVFVDFAETMVTKLENKNKITKNKKLKIVDLGCLYGNSSLALIDNKSWSDTISFWMNQDQELEQNKYYVIGADLSEEALLFGVQRGIYDAIFIQDFNEILIQN